MTKAKPKKPTKPPLQRLPSDDCELTFDEVDYHPHEGEWVEIVPPGLTLGDVSRLRGIHELSAKLEALGETDDAATERAILTGETYRAIAPALCDRIAAWNWTDPRGEPYPQPTTDVMARLDVREVIYLHNLTQGTAGGS